MKTCNYKYSNLMITSVLFLLFIISIASPVESFAKTGQTGRITGKIVDATDGEPMLGVVVMIANTTIGAQTDLDGQFVISNVEPGNYNLEVKCVGYANTTVEEVEVVTDDVVVLNFALEPEVMQEEDVVVTAKRIQNTDAALLSIRQKSNSISDAISAETFSKTGSSTVADAMNAVTGATVNNGKFVNIRGNEGRYCSAHINGTELPTADPEKRAFHMDILPTNLLDNIEVIKSFTPDKPGNFSGGIVNIATKDYPEVFNMKFSASSSYNKLANNNDNFLTSPGGDKDWLGYDDGTRSLPDIINEFEVPPIGYAFQDSGMAYMLDTMTKAFNENMAPVKGSKPLNQSYAFSLGNQIKLFDRPLGYLGSLSYSRKYSFYEDGKINNWKLTSASPETEELSQEYAFSDAHGEETVLWGGLFTTSYKFHNNHDISFNYMHTQNGESSARYVEGVFYDGNISEDAVFQTRVIKYTERTLNSVQLDGKHAFPSIMNSKINWNVSYNKNIQNEPDSRYFTNHLKVQESGDTSFAIRGNLYKDPQRFFRDMNEDNLNYDLKWSIPFKQWDGLNSKLSFGTQYAIKNRSFRERVFMIMNQNSNTYDGNPEEYFSDDNSGIAYLSPYGFYEFYNYVQDATSLRAQYSGEQDVFALFGMVEMPFSQKFRFVGGVRYETTNIETVTQDDAYEPGIVDEGDILPALSFIYQLTRNVNMRLSYGRTLARPSFREMAPFPSWDFHNGYYVIGNPEMKRTLIDNVDLRYEWFARPGEIIAGSVFYKYFKDPIERAIKNDNGEIQFQNVSQAHVVGAEFEIRKQLDFITRVLRNFQMGFNLTLINSSVDIPEDELIRRKAADPNTSETRPLQGQSSYLLNWDLSFNTPSRSTQASLTFNIFGERLSEVSKGGTPDIYEQPRPDLNFVFKQKILGFMTLKASVKNIFNSNVLKEHHFKGKDFLNVEHERGRTFSLGLTYSL